MGMRENPAQGYVIEAEKLKQVLPTTMQETYQSALDDHDFEKAHSLLVENFPDNLPCPDSIFSLADEDTGDGDLETGVSYAYFDEASLYMKIETPELVAMRQILGQTPSLHAWTIWA